jgi:hypothetical protein
MLARADHANSRDRLRNLAKVIRSANLAERPVAGPRRQSPRCAALMNIATASNHP